MSKLYVIGIGPGDPELLTLKAVRILKEVPCICVPKGKEEGCSLALSIVKKALNLEGKEIIEAYFPMVKTKKEGQKAEIGEIMETAKNIIKILRKKDVAFITIGDPTIYSTFFYLYDRLLGLNTELDIEIIPGISSINASSSKAKIPLGLADEKIAILPANYCDNLKDTLNEFNTIVLMKVHKVFDKILRVLNEMNLTDKAVYVSRVGMEDEKIFRNIREVKSEDLNYFSMMIIKKGNYDDRY